MNKFFLKFLAVLLLSIANQGCTNNSIENKSTKFSFSVAASNLVVKNKPGVESTEIAILKQGNVVFFADSISNLVSTVKMGDKTYTQPWLLIQTEGVKGWVFGGGLRYDDSLHSRLLAQIDYKVLTHHFGPTLASKVERLSNRLKQASTDKAIASCFIESNNLRDSLVLKLELEESKDNFSEMELGPLSQKLSFLIPEMVAGGTSIFLFQDYKSWLASAKKSPGKEDDTFFELMAYVYPDSIEGFYPVWAMQTSVQSGCSKLGQNVHVEMLKRLDNAHSSAPSFAPLIVGLKKELVRDLLEATHFSETREKAIAELNLITISPSKLITQEDKVALEVRLSQLKKGTSSVRFESFGEE